MAASGTGAVFFLGSRAHYQVLEQPNNYDVENGNASTETIYQNRSVEELWPTKQTDKLDYDANYNSERLAWNYCDKNATYDRTKAQVSCVKRRNKRRSSEALLCDDFKPAVLNTVDDKTDHAKPKPRRISLLSFLASLARRKRRMPTDQVHYLQHLETVLNTCTYRESCRCLDCQSRYFECAEESDEYCSDDDYSYSVQDVESPDPEADDLDDEVFIDPIPDNDNTSTDLLIDEKPSPEEREESEVLEAEGETDKQLQLEVAASTSAMLNLLLYHPFSCVIQ